LIRDGKSHVEKLRQETAGWLCGIQDQSPRSIVGVFCRGWGGRLFFCDSPFKIKDKTPLFSLRMGLFYGIIRPEICIKLSKENKMVAIKSVQKAKKTIKPVGTTPLAEKNPQKTRRVFKIMIWAAIAVLIFVGIYGVARMGVNRAIDKNTFCGDALSPNLCECVRSATKSELGLISKTRLVRGNMNLSDAEVNKLADKITRCIMQKSDAEEQAR
jgi:hypothetical protein